MMESVRTAITSLFACFALVTPSPGAGRDARSVHGRFDRDPHVTSNTNNRPCLVDSGSYLSLADAVSRTDCERSTIVISAPQTVTTNLTIPDTIALEFNSGGVITVSTGRTLTILGPLRAPVTTIFANATAGQGAISFAANHCLEAVSPAWWQGTDDGAKLNAAIAALPAGGGTVDATAWEGARSIATPVLVNKPAKLRFGAATFTCPLNASCFKTWTNAATYSKISFEGLGRGLTTFQVPSGASPQVSANH
jgi:hypothetical protein